MARKKDPNAKLNRQLASERTGEPRLRVRGYDPLEPGPAFALLKHADGEEPWADTAWVAHGGALVALVWNETDRFWRVVHRRGELLGQGEELVLEEIAHALARRAMLLCRVVYARGGTPVWIDGVSRLVGPGLDEHDAWFSRLVRRAHAPSGAKYLKEARDRGLAPFQALGFLAQMTDSTADDVAKLCATQRAAVLAAIWDDWVEEPLKR